jgi:hypothetical protein
MRRLYLIVPGPELAGRLVEELLSEDLTGQSMRLLSRRPRELDALPVPVTGFRPSPDNILLRILGGAAAALMVALLTVAFSGAGQSTVPLLLIVTLIGAAAGAATLLWWGFPAELRPLRGELKREDLVMLLDVPDERLGELERAIASRHPEVRVKGTHPAGSPPVP